MSDKLSEPTELAGVSLVSRLGTPIEPKPGSAQITEMAREKIAFMLVFGFIALLLSSMLFTGTVDDAIKLIQTISSAISGMVGAVLGYYYGTSGQTKTTTTTQGNQ